MFKWIDYEKNSCLFIERISENVAVLRHKDYELTDCATGSKIKIKETSLDKAKESTEIHLLKYWKQVNDVIQRNLKAIK